MRWLALMLLTAGHLATGGCTCSRPKATPASIVEGGPAEAGPPTASSDAAGVPTVASPSVFSAPIGATRFSGGDAVAGLVAKDGVLRAMGLLDGQVRFTTDVLSPVAWSADAELKLQRAGDGLALLWRGLYQGKNGRTVVPSGPTGSRAASHFPSEPPSARSRTGLSG
jgi:hypothetical protein